MSFFCHKKPQEQKRVGDMLAVLQGANHLDGML